MAHIIPVSTLIKDQIELQSLKNDLLSKYRDINNRLEEKYQQRINHLMQQHASYQQELHSHYMHQLNYIQNQLMNIHCQLSMHESNKNQSNKNQSSTHNNTTNNQTKQPEATSIEHEDDDISQQQIIDSNPMDIDMTTHDIQCDNTNIPFSVTPIAINIENDTQQTVSNANDSSTTHRSVVRQQTLNVMRAIQSKRNDINDNNNNKEHKDKNNNKNNKRKRKKKKMDNSNDKKRKNRKRKRKYECVDEQIGNETKSKRRKIDDKKFKRRRCSSLNSLSVSKIIDNVTNYESKHKVQTRGQTVRKQRMSKLRRSSLAFF